MVLYHITIFVKIRQHYFLFSYGISFDPLDMPAGQFVTGCDAWKLCRSGTANPDDFGIFEMHGLSFVRGDLIRDIASFNKTELLPWDCWGLMMKEDKDLSEKDYALLDKAAGLVMTENMEIADLYKSSTGILAAGKIKSYSQAGFTEFVLE